MPAAGEAEVQEAWSFYQQVILHAQLSQALAVAAEWRLADYVDAGATDLATLSARVGCKPEGMVRLLRLLESAGIVVRRGPDRYALTTRGALLRSHADAGVRNTMRWWGRYRWRVWAHLAASLATSRGSRAQALGSEGFDHLDSDGDAASAFNGAMAEIAGPLGRQLARTCDLTGARTVVDVGGGDASLLTTLLSANDDLSGILVDRPHAVAAARRRLAAHGLSERCTLVVGDFFQALPPGGDVYVLQRILHDWDDERCLAICSRCRDAMRHGARLLVIERMLSPDDDGCERDIHVDVSDLNMLVMLGGKERTEDEIRSILARASLHAVASIPLVLGFRALVAQRSPDATY